MTDPKKFSLYSDYQHRQGSTKGYWLLGKFFAVFVPSGILLFLLWKISQVDQLRDYLRLWHSDEPGKTSAGAFFFVLSSIIFFMVCRRLRKFVCDF